MDADRDKLTGELAQIASVWLDGTVTLAKVVDWVGQASPPAAPNPVRGRPAGKPRPVCRYALRH